MALKRIIIDTQSNALFRGSAVEQNYDQRGGLCQVGEGHAVVTTHPVHADYLRYWELLGFSIPHLVVAGPYSPRHTLSELIINNTEAQKEIIAFAGRDAARLEFFYIEKSEQTLSETLGIPAYCNFDLSLSLSKKLAFKDLCRQLDIPTPDWCYHPEKDHLIESSRKWLASGDSLMIKANDGTGGKACGSMLRIDTPLELSRAAAMIRGSSRQYFTEAMIKEAAAVVSLHWEIDIERKVVPIGLFEHVTRDDSQVGNSHPTILDDRVTAGLWSVLQHRLGPYLLQQGAIGFFQCDIIVDRQGNPYWIDFNPRKGAGIYVWDMVGRLSAKRLNGASCYFSNEHVTFSRSGQKFTFTTLFRTLEDILEPGQSPFVVITNPGVLEFGCIDITGISVQSRQAAEEILKAARARLT